jgi:hypothetical protein
MGAGLSAGQAPRSKSAGSVSAVGAMARSRVRVRAKGKSQSRQREGESQSKSQSEKIERTPEDRRQGLDNDSGGDLYILISSFIRLIRLIFNLFSGTYFSIFQSSRALPFWQRGELVQHWP